MVDPLIKKKKNIGVPSKIKNFFNIFLVAYESHNKWGVEEGPSLGFIFTISKSCFYYEAFGHFFCLFVFFFLFVCFLFLLIVSL